MSWSTSRIVTPASTIARSRSPSASTRRCRGRRRVRPCRPASGLAASAGRRRRACAGPGRARSACGRGGRRGRARRGRVRRADGRGGGAATRGRAAKSCHAGAPPRPGGSRPRRGRRRARPTARCARGRPGAPVGGERADRSRPANTIRPAGRDEAGDAVDEGRLARAVRSDEADELPVERRSRSSTARRPPKVTVRPWVSSSAVTVRLRRPGHRPRRVPAARAVRRRGSRAQARASGRRRRLRG